MSYNENYQKAKELIGSIAEDMKVAVQHIEDGPMITKDHYGEYLSMLSKFENNKDYMCTVALALVEAGKAIGIDNANGVRNATKIKLGMPLN